MNISCEGQNAKLECIAQNICETDNNHLPAQMLLALGYFVHNDFQKAYTIFHAINTPQNHEEFKRAIIPFSISCLMQMNKAEKQQESCIILDYVLEDVTYFEQSTESLRQLVVLMKNVISDFIAIQDIALAAKKIELFLHELIRKTAAIPNITQKSVLEKSKHSLFWQFGTQWFAALQQKAGQASVVREFEEKIYDTIQANLFNY